MSEEVSEVPKELLESVRDAVGRKVKLSLRRRVKLEIKGDKTENRVLALASHRAYLLTARIPTKVEHSLNYLEIQGIACNKPTQVNNLSPKLCPAHSDSIKVVAPHFGK
ncbi:F-actin-uncapping protein LRRC16A [Liparis tanakae]|uniref:F-actin-uncapping protein LRRC16A n=1 Tax=Liparis tanakae TaxID=230148 RepID=A0A4Z2IQ66_9TELE|nr:F-actin-uncapping protein LRRC16A [Liparis tanakae]